MARDIQLKREGDNMTKAVQVMIMGLVVGMVCQGIVHAEEVGQPVRFSVGVLGQSTDNRDSVDVGKEDNVDIYVRPRLDIVKDGEAGRLVLYYVPSYRYRSKPGDNQDDSTWQHDFGLKGSRSVSPRTRLRLFEAFALTDDPAIEEGGITMRGDQSYIRNTLQVGLNYDLLEYSNLDITVLNRIKRYDENTVAVRSDEDETTAKADVRHQISQTLRTLFSGSYSMFGYDGASNLQRDFSSVVGAVGLENSFSPNTMGTVSVGWQTRDYEDAELDADGAPYARVSLEGLAGADVKVGGVVVHGVRDSDSYPFASQEYTDLRGFADFGLSPKINVRASGTYRLSSYDEDDVPSGASSTDFVGARSGDETTIVADIELSVAVAANIAVTVGQRYEDIDSDVAQSYTKNTSRVGASVSF